MNNKYIGIALGVSILINAFLCGFLLSRHMDKNQIPFINGHHGPPPMENMMLHIVKSQSEKLSQDGQKTVQTITDKYQKIISKPDMDKMEPIFTDIQKAMTADTFDSAKVEKLHKQLNTTELESKTAIGNMMTEIASKLSKSDRIAFFTDLFPPRPNGGHPNDKPHGPPPDHGPPDDFDE